MSPESLVCRLLIDPPASGDWNMAIDEALLTAAAEGEGPTLRLYQWSEPTLSLGYFQRYADRQQHIASRECAVVRRSSGGGAILHDRELTYSLTLPANHPLAREPERIYRAVHQAFIESLAPLLTRVAPEWSLELCTAPAGRASDNEPFLCFERRSRGDLLLVPRNETGTASPNAVSWKVLGSAQRRRGGAILQHGSLLIERSPAAPELPGLNDLAGLPGSADDLLSTLPEKLAPRIGARMVDGSLSPAVRSAAERLSNDKYASRHWTERR